MAEHSVSKQEVEENQDDGKGGKNSNSVVEHLQAPRKKRKNFVIFAPGPSVDNDTLQVMIRFVKAAYPKFSVATPTNYDEFVRQFSRNIMLAIVDDEFIGRNETLELVRVMKLKKTDGATPVLFLTRHPEELVAAYNNILAQWHEVDEYINPATTPRPYIFQKIKSGVDDRFRRKSRRFKVQFPVSFGVLDHGDRVFKGRILDMSVHGALLKADENHIFSAKDQILVHIPIGQFVPGSEEDIMRIAAKVKRVFISGDRVGISWAYLTEGKLNQLTKIVAGIVNTSVGKSAAAARAKIARAQAESGEGREIITKKDPASA